MNIKMENLRKLKTNQNKNKRKQKIYTSKLTKGSQYLKQLKEFIEICNQNTESIIEQQK